jgi:hypothetical protein
MRIFKWLLRGIRGGKVVEDVYDDLYGDLEAAVVHQPRNSKQLHMF